MAQIPFKDLLTAWKKDSSKALKIKGESQVLGVDENGNEVPLKVDSEGRVLTTVTGSLTGLSTDPKPQGQEGWTYTEYNESTSETKVYKFIGGDWREL